MAREQINLKTVATALVALFIIGYALFEARALLAGPRLEVWSPVSGQMLDDPLINVQGQASQISKIYLNERQIFTDEAGKFDEPLLLSVGYNIIVVRVEDHIGRSIRQQLEVVLH